VTRYLNLENILSYHAELMAEQGQQSLLMGEGGTAKLEAALARPQSSVFGEDAFPTLSQKAAALLQAVAIGHPFTDGNKRAAAGATLAFLRINGVSSHADETAFGDLVLAATTGELREVEDIATRIADLFGLEA
jgi:death-on-curing protein